MMRVHIWLRKKDGMTLEEFRDYWLSTHAPIARDGYDHLQGYRVNVVTGAPRGQDVAFDGLAELWWDSRDGFAADMKSEAARASTEDLARFTSATGILFVEHHIVK